METDAGERLHELEERLRSAEGSPDWIDAANNLAWDIREVDPGRSKSLSEDAYRLATSGEFETEPYSIGIVMSLRTLAHASRRAGDLEISLSQSMRALEGLRNGRLPAVEVDILRNTAIILGQLGNFPEAFEYGFRALSTAESIHDRAREGLVRGSIGVIYLHSQSYTEADAFFRKALSLHRDLGDRREEALALNNLSVASKELGRVDDALATSLESLQLAKETGFQALVVTASGTVAEVYLAKGDFENAGRYLRDYLANAQTSGSKRDETWARILLGELDLKLNRLDSAAEHLSLGLAIAREAGMRREESRCHDRMSTVFEQQGDLRQALSHLRSFVEVKETIFNEATARTMAYLQVLHNVETARKDAEINFLRTVQLQKEIEAHKVAENALEHLAATDPLTGVLNRRKLLAMGEEAAISVLRGGQKLAAILVDIDHFKAINDNYGHASGDAALTGVADIIRSNLRKGELLGRIGGDEFAVLLPDSDKSQAIRIARRIQKHLASESFQFNGEAVSVKASFGVAEFERATDSKIDSLLNRADRAMYSAKQSGRNRVALFRNTKRK